MALTTNEATNLLNEYMSQLDLYAGNVAGGRTGMSRGEAFIREGYLGRALHVLDGQGQVVENLVGVPFIKGSTPRGQEFILNHLKALGCVFDQEAANNYAQHRNQYEQHFPGERVLYLDVSNAENQKALATIKEKIKSNQVSFSEDELVDLKPSIGPRAHVTHVDYSLGKLSNPQLIKR